MQNLIEGTPELGWFITTFLVLSRMMSVHGPKVATSPATIRYPRYKKAN